MSLPAQLRHDLDAAGDADLEVRGLLTPVALLLSAHQHNPQEEVAELKVEFTTRLEAAEKMVSRTWLRAPARCLGAALTRTRTQIITLKAERESLLKRLDGANKARS